MDIFREAETPLSTSAVIDEVIGKKGFDCEVIDVRALRASEFVILRRSQGNGTIRDESREGLEINWGLVKSIIATY